LWKNNVTTVDCDINTQVQPAHTHSWVFVTCVPLQTALYILHLVAKAMTIVFSMRQELDRRSIRQFKSCCYHLPFISR
jgi:hypothetical protein